MATNTFTILPIDTKWTIFLFCLQELNNRLTLEITRMRSCFSGETALSPLTQGKDLYELEVLTQTLHIKLTCNRYKVLLAFDTLKEVGTLHQPLASGYLWNLE